jgi:hypothetical protein
MKKYKKIKKLFEIEYCEGCGCYMVICPKCGNNCCNSGVGDMDGNGNPVQWGTRHKHEGGTGCDICKLAYQYQDLYWKMQKVCTCPHECICEMEEDNGFLTGKRFENPECPVHCVDAGIDPNCPIHGN